MNIKALGDHIIIKPMITEQNQSIFDLEDDGTMIHESKLGKIVSVGPSVTNEYIQAGHWVEYNQMAILVSQSGMDVVKSEALLLKREDLDD